MIAIVKTASYQDLIRAAERINYVYGAGGKSVDQPYLALYCDHGTSLSFSRPESIPAVSFMMPCGQCVGVLYGDQQS